MKKQEERKHHVNIGTIGHVEHGKTKLTEAIIETLNTQNANSPSVANGKINSNKIRTRGITINLGSKEEPDEME